jgi:signal transduction histidine kinase
MLNFADLKNKSIIFICCVVTFFCQTDFRISVTTILIATIFSGFISYFDRDDLKTGLSMGFIALCWFVPELTFFLPLIAYDMFFHKYQYILFLGVIPLVVFFQYASLQVISVVLILLLFCVLIKYLAKTQFELQYRYNELRDETREMSIQLKKQNNDLIEKQDNELYLATLNERNRIAREIHDNVGHLLSSAILQSAALLTTNKDEKVREHLKTMNDTLSQAMNSIRNSVHELYDESIDLNAKIEELIKQFTFCELTYEYDISSNPDKNLKYAFVSIVKEALSNVMKHSNATHVYIVFREHPGFYQLIVKDNGIVKNWSKDNGLGLNNMIERVNSFNGNINIMTEKGFEIFISITKGGLT